MKPITGGIAFCLAIGVAISGCAGPAPQVQPSAAPPAAASYDGRYEGTVRVTGASTGMSLRDCETPPRISVEVRNNRFSLAQPHPNVTGLTSSKTTPIYNATIQPDGGIKGISNETNATMEGRVSGTRMVGQIYGLLCYYEFTADRV